MFQVTFQNRVATASSWAEVEQIKARWCAGKSRRLVQRFFQVTELSSAEEAGRIRFAMYLRHAK